MTRTNTAGTEYTFTKLARCYGNGWTVTTPEGEHMGRITKERKGYCATANTEARKVFAYVGTFEKALDKITS